MNIGHLIVPEDGLFWLMERKIKTRSLPSQDIDKNFRGYVNITLGKKTNECTNNYDY